MTTKELGSIKEVYEKYKHLDKLFSALGKYKEQPQYKRAEFKYVIMFDLWQAIKRALVEAGEKK